MAKNLQTGDKIYVPCSKIPELANRSTTFYITEVVAVKSQGRSVKVQLPEGEYSDWIASSFIHRTVGIYIFSIGDYVSEPLLLEPLTHSIFQFCKLIHSDATDVVQKNIRSVAELKTLWQNDIDAYKYVIFVGHGDKSGLHFGVEGCVSAEDLCRILKTKKTTEKTIIFLCCQTGYQEFSQPISTLSFCSSVIAPFHKVHGATASQFCQTFLVNHLLEGHTTTTAFKKSRQNIPGSSNFRLWQNGRLKGGPRK